MFVFNTKTQIKRFYFRTRLGENKDDDKHTIHVVLILKIQQRTYHLRSSFVSNISKSVVKNLKITGYNSNSSAMLQYKNRFSERNPKMTQTMNSIYLRSPNTKCKGLMTVLGNISPFFERPELWFQASDTFI